MTTAEANHLADQFAARAAQARANGDLLAALTWNEAAADVLKAEGDSITRAYERSRHRTARKSIGLRLTR
jgi:hypothetical protein